MVMNKSNIERVLLWIQEAVAHQKRGNLKDAKQLLEKAIQVARKEGNEEILAASLSQLGQVYLYEKNFSKAVENVKESVLIRTRLKDFRGLSIDYQLIGNIMMTGGMLDEAEGFFIDSLGLASGLKDDNLIAAAESNLGIIYFQKDELKKAKTHFQNSQKIRKRLGDRVGIARNLNHLGRIEEDMGNLKKARKFYEESLAILRSLGAIETKIALDNLERVETKLKRK